MHSTHRLIGFTFLGMCALGTASAVAADDPKPNPAGPPAAPAGAGSDKPAPGGPTEREKAILDVAGRYTTFRMATPWPMWALASCRALDPTEISGVPSRSDDQRTHGEKLYKLWVSDHDAYLRVSGMEPRGDKHPAADAKVAPAMASSPVGQTLVKETFQSIAVPKSEEPKPNPYRRDLVVDGDRAFRQGAPAELFIMTKLDPKTPDTDNGWVYAVVSTDRKSVLRSGRLASCMRCHEQTTRDRLYGPEDSWPKDKDGKAMLPIVKTPEKKAAPTMVPPKPNP
jgi:hypothetical protein